MRRLTHTIPEPSHGARVYKVGDEVLFHQHRALVSEVLDPASLLYEIQYEEDYRGSTAVIRKTVEWRHLLPVGLDRRAIWSHRFDLDPVKVYLEGIIAKTESNFLNISPRYQRAHQWTPEQTDSFLRGIFDGRNIGKFVIRSLPDNSPEFDEQTHLYTCFGEEIVDGKNRLEALIQFYESRVSVRGAFFHDLTTAERQRFLDMKLPVLDFDPEPDAKGGLIETIRLFLWLHEGSRQLPKGLVRKLRAKVEAAKIKADTARRP